MIFNLRKKTIYLLFILVGNLFSQSQKMDSISTFEFKWSNDFEYKTDQYFTNGFAFEVFNANLSNNPINSILLPTQNCDFELFGISLIQDIFTPKNKFNVQNQLNGDRPFAAYLLVGFTKSSFNPNDGMVYNSQMQLGIIGPLAFGEETQNGIHRNISTSAQVIGWENQIKNSFVINYSASIEKNLFNNNWFELSGITSAKIGVPFTNANVGLKSRIGFFDSFPKNFDFLSTQKWQLFVNLSANVGIIGYNATLQGGLFSENIYTLSEINRFVGNASLGFTAIYKSLKLEYTQHFNTAEFPKADNHSWGYFLIKFAF